MCLRVLAPCGLRTSHTCTVLRAKLDLSESLGMKGLLFEQRCGWSCLPGATCNRAAVRQATDPPVVILFHCNHILLLCTRSLCDPVRVLHVKFTPQLGAMCRSARSTGVRAFVCVCVRACVRVCVCVCVCVASPSLASTTSASAGRMAQSPASTTTLTAGGRVCRKSREALTCCP